MKTLRTKYTRAPNFMKFQQFSLISLIFSKKIREIRDNLSGPPNERSVDRVDRQMYQDFILYHSKDVVDVSVTSCGLVLHAFSANPSQVISNSL
mgnify:CR=1 FL=1